MELTSLASPEFGPADPTGRRKATGRLWIFVSPETRTTLELFVAGPGALPEPKVGDLYQIQTVPETRGPTELGLIGHNRNDGRLYRIVKDAGYNGVL